MIIHNMPVAKRGLPLSEAKKVCIMCHGRGDNAAQFITLSDAFREDDFAFVAIQAVANTWYPYPFTAPLQQNQPQLDMSLDAISEMLDNLEGLNFKPNQIFFCGFSQGACLTLEYCARHARRYGGVVAFSGGVLGPELDESRYAGKFENMPVFIGCSDNDPHIPEERVHETARLYEKMGAKVVKRIYPNMGHTVIDDEIKLAQGVFDEVI